MNADPSQDPERLLAQETKLVADISQLAREVLSLSEQLDVPVAEQTSYVFEVKDRQIRLPEHLNNFLQHNENGPKLVAVEVAFTTTRLNDYAGLEISFELTDGQTIVAWRDASSSIDQGFVLKIEDEAGEPLDISYGSYPATEINRMLLSLIYDRAERASFPDGYAKKIDIQEYGTALLIRDALEKRSDSFSRKRVTDFNDTKGHTLNVTESHDSHGQLQYVVVEATTTTLGDHEGELAIFETSEILEIAEPYDRARPAEVMRIEGVRDFNSAEQLDKNMPISGKAKLKDLLAFNTHLHRMRAQLELAQPSSLNYDDIDPNQEN